MSSVEPRSQAVPSSGDVADVQRKGSVRATFLARRFLSFPVLMGVLLAAATVGSIYSNLHAAAKSQGSPRYCVFEGDTWWHLATGERILATHTWPTHDRYSFTASGDNWIAYEWLGDVFMALSSRVAGLTGMTILSVALAALIVVLLYAYADLKSGNAKAAFVSCALMLPLLIIFVDLRPQLLGYTFLLITLISLEGFRRGRLTKLWFLPGVSLLWVNTHGTFVFGMAILVLYWACGTAELQAGSVRMEAWTHKQRRHLGLVTLLSLIAMTVTPYGTQLAAYPMEMAFMQPVNIASFQEWKSPDFSTTYGKFLLGMILLILVVHLVGRLEYHLEEIVLLLFSIYAACLHMRFVILFILIFAPLLARWLAKYLPRYASSNDKYALNAILIILIAVGSIKLFPPRSVLQQVVRNGFPQGAVEYIKQHPTVKPVFDKEFWGGYLINELGARPTVFIDGRADLYEAAGVLPDYLNIMKLAPLTFFLLRKYHVRSCLIEPKSALAVLLSHSPGWQSAYSDNLSVLFVHRKEIASNNRHQEAVRE